MAPYSFCTHLAECSRHGCSSTGCVADENPRTCDDLLGEIDALIGAAHPALAEASALCDIISSEEPTTEVCDGADDLAVALFLGRRALDSAIRAVTQRPIQMPALFTGIRTVAELDAACRTLVEALLDELARRVA